MSENEDWRKDFQDKVKELEKSVKDKEELEATRLKKNERLELVEKLILENGLKAVKESALYKSCENDCSNASSEHKITLEKLNKIMKKGCIHLPETTPVKEIGEEAKKAFDKILKQLTKEKRVLERKTEESLAQQKSIETANSQKKQEITNLLRTKDIEIEKLRAKAKRLEDKMKIKKAEERECQKRLQKAETVRDSLISNESKILEKENQIELLDVHLTMALFTKIHPEKEEKKTPSPIPLKKTISEKLRGNMDREEQINSDIKSHCETIKCKEDTYEVSQFRTVCWDNRDDELVESKIYTLEAMEQYGNIPEYKPILERINTLSGNIAICDVVIALFKEKEELIKENIELTKEIKESYPADPPYAEAKNDILHADIESLHKEKTTLRQAILNLKKEIGMQTIKLNELLCNKGRLREISTELKIMKEEYEEINSNIKIEKIDYEYYTKDSAKSPRSGAAEDTVKAEGKQLTSQLDSLKRKAEDFNLVYQDFMSLYSGYQEGLQKLDIAEKKRNQMAEEAIAKEAHFKDEKAQLIKEIKSIAKKINSLRIKEKKEELRGIREMSKKSQIEVKQTSPAEDPNLKSVNFAR